MAVPTRTDPPAGSPFTARRRPGGIEINFPWQALPPDVLRIGLGLTALGAGLALVAFLMLLVAIVVRPQAIGVAVAGFSVLASLLVVGLGLSHLLRQRTAQPTAVEVNRVRQLAAIDGILVRRGSWGGKQIWYADEIRDLRAENYWLGKDLLLGVVLRSPDEEPFTLYGAVPFTDSTPEQRAELEWIASELRRALEIPDDPENPAPPGAADARVASEGIMEKSPHVRPRD